MRDRTPDLNIGVIFEVFQSCETQPREREQLNTDRYEQMDPAHPFNITLEIPSGPEAVLDFSELIILIMSISEHSKVESDRVALWDLPIGTCYSESKAGGYLYFTQTFSVLKSLALLWALSLSLM